MIAAFWGTLVVAVTTTALEATLPLYAKSTFGFDSRDSGILFLAILLPCISSPIFGKICDKYGPRWLAVGGFIFAFPFFVLLRLVTHYSTGQIVLLCFLLLCTGLAHILTMTPLM